MLNKVRLLASGLRASINERLRTMFQLTDGERKIILLVVFLFIVGLIARSIRIYWQNSQ
ncbi:MAG: hypothetical protein GX230_07910 [Lentisphaerae bacterium]|nr:hypothetical protein [Lentisphaerota bacterium]